MPPFSAAARRTGTNLSIQYRDFTGRARSSSIEISPVADEADVTALQVASGNMSNARVMEQRVIDFAVQVNPANPANTAFDEAYATIDDALVLMFQNNTTGDIRPYQIPAPDAIFFLPDGETVVEPDDGAAAGTGPLLLSVTIEAYIAIAGTGWVYARGYKEGTRKRARQPLPLAEPTGLPGDAPGL